MKLTSAKLYRMEQLMLSRQGLIQKKKIPEQWEDFAKLTEIRSGGQMVTFKPYYYQKIISNLMDEFNNIVCVKSRQLGLTQIILSKFLHRACLNPAYSAMAFLRNGDDAGAISRRARQLLSGLNEYVTPDSDNIGYLKLKSLGEIYFKNSSREGSRSYDSILDFLFDEAAFSENIQQIYAASSPSGALAGDKITKMIVSTPSSKNSWYWHKLNENNGNIDIEKLCADVASGKTYKETPGLYWFVDSAGTVKIIVHWTAHPIYSQNPNYLQYRLQQDGTDEETVLREYDLRFIDSSVSVFSASLINLNCIGGYENSRVPKCKYYCGLDVATVGNDYTVFVVLKLENDIYSIVSLYRRRGETSEFHLYQINQLLKTYKPEITGIEVSGGTGQLYFEQLVKAFPWLHFRRINTTGDSKPKMISTLNLMLEKQELIYPQKCPIIEEFLSFRRQGKKLEAASGKHDDCIMSTAFAASVSPFNSSEISNVDFSKITFHDDDE